MSITRTGLPILVELIDLVNCVIIFLSQMTLLRWLTFLLGSQTVILIVLLFWIYFSSDDSMFYNELPSIGKSWSCCLGFHWLSIKFKTRCPVSSHSLTIFVLIGVVFMIIWEVFHGKIFFNSASAAASEFCQWVQVGIDVYIPHRKYQIEHHSSPWFSTTCAAVILHRNHFFSFVSKE